jgi:hypothetical protein
MSVTFHRSPRTLVEEIKRAGYHIVEITSDIGDPARSLQVALKNGVVVNWDRDSRSVWAHGPQPLSDKVEAYIASQRHRHRPHKKSSAGPLFAMLLLVASLLLAILWESASRPKSDADLAPPVATNTEGSP